MSETRAEATTNALLAAAQRGDQEKVKALIASGDTDLLRDALQGFLGLVKSATTPEAREEALLVGVALGIMQVEDAPTEPLPEIQTLNDEATQQGEEAVLPRIREYLQKHPEAVNDVWPNFKVTPLIAAACSGLAQTVRLLLELGADRTATNSLGETAAQRCRKLGYIDIADTIEQWSNVQEYIEILSKVNKAVPSFSDMKLQTLREMFGEKTFPRWLDTIANDHDGEDFFRSDENPALWKITEYYCYMESLNPITKPGLATVEYILNHFPSQFTDIMSYFCAMSIVSPVYDNAGYYTSPQIAVAD